MLLPFLPKFAHEVYVLTPDQVSNDKSQEGVNLLHALTNRHDLYIFIFITLVLPVVLGLVIFLKMTNPFQKLGKWIDKATIIAPDIIRMAFGASLILSAMNNAVFGPELPLSNFPAPNFLKFALFTIGFALLLGVFTRIFAWLSLILWCFIFAIQGWYILTYANYLGEAIAVILLSSQMISFDSLLAKLRHKKLPKGPFEEFSMPISRVLFGFALLYAAITVKFLNPAVALDVVTRYNLTDYFPFDPLFIVLGAALTELGLAILFMMGFLRRFISVIFLIFLSLSIIYFKESVWPHFLLIGFGVGIFLHKPDIWAVDKYFFTGKSSKKKTVKNPKMSSS